MRRIFLLLVLIQTVLFAGTASAQGVSFLDDFNYFDGTRWSKGDHTLGRSYLDPANVDVDGENLRIKLPARTLEGGEILTNDLHRFLLSPDQGPIRAGLDHGLLPLQEPRLRE